jgi:formate hydrogenlyase subunit 3/multisubunit Na+/H+ antiporter MnhD subunit
LALLGMRNVWRMLFFSTAAEAGYVLMGFGIGTPIGHTGAIMHLIYQAVMRGLVFVTAWQLTRRAGSSRTADLVGSFQRAPVTAALFGFGMFSVMGLSPFKGAFSKFVILYAGIDSGNWVIAAAGTLGSIIAAVYFVHSVQVVCFQRTRDGFLIDRKMSLPSLDAGQILAALLTVATIVLSLDPQPFLTFAAHLAGVHDIAALPQFEAPWSIPIMIPYVGAFAVLALGGISARLRDAAAVALASATLAVVIWTLRPGDLGDLFAVLFAAIGLAVVVYSLGYMRREHALTRYYFFLLLVIGSLLGVATSHHLGNFYLFWELMTWSSYILVIHEQTDKALKAGAKYFLICTSGAYVMQFGILLLQARVGTFDIGGIAAHIGDISPLLLVTIALCFMTAFVAKAGLFPLHTWLPAAHPVAPASISAPMSGILTAAGILGMLNILFAVFGVPALARAATIAGLSIPGAILVVLGGITLLIGEIRAWQQTDIKRMLAYSTVAQMGEVAMVLGIGTPLALTGAMMHLVNHALMKSLLFFVAGAFIMRVGGQSLADLRGIGKAMPRTAFPMAIGLLAIMAVPPFGGFVSKFLMIYAAVDAGYAPVAAVMLVGGVIGAMYYVRVLRIVFLEPYTGPTVAEAPRSMRLVHTSLAALLVLNGLYPALLLRLLVPVTAVLAGRSLLPLPTLPPLTMQWSAAAAIAVIGAIIAYVIGRRSPRRGGAVAVGTMALALTGVLLQTARYDLLSLGFALLITAMGGLNLAYSIGYMAREHASNRYFFAFVMMIGGLLGLVASKDLYSFFAFWELLSSWTLYLVTVHEETREALDEGYKYFIFNFIGASILFMGVTLLAAHAHTFRIADLAHAAAGMPHIWLGAAVALILAGLLMKAAQLPLRIDYQMHPVPAPTPASGYISAVLLKVGPYSVLKFFVALGAVATFAKISGGSAWMPNLMHLVAVIAAVTLLYAGAKCMVETGVKRLLIYSTVSQLGYILLGLALGTPLGIAGGMMHAVNHMMLKNTLFLVAGCLISQVHVTSLDELGGLGRRMPITFGIFLFMGLSVSGIPPLNGFASKWMIYQAAFQSGDYMLGLAAMISSLFTLAAILKFAHTAFMGELSPTAARMHEAPAIMLVPMLILTAACAVIGLLPGLLLVPISHVQAALGLAAVPATWLGGVPGPLPWNPAALTVALLASGALGWAYRALSSRQRVTSHIYTGGITTLATGSMQVPASSLYETPAQLVHLALPNFADSTASADDDPHA